MKSIAIETVTDSFIVRFPSKEAAQAFQADILSGAGRVDVADIAAVASLRGGKIAAESVGRVCICCGTSNCHNATNEVP